MGMCLYILDICIYGIFIHLSIFEGVYIYIHIYICILVWICMCIYIYDLFFIHVYIYIYLSLSLSPFSALPRNGDGGLGRLGQEPVVPGPGQALHLLGGVLEGGLKGSAVLGGSGVELEPKKGFLESQWLIMTGYFKPIMVYFGYSVYSFGLLGFSGSGLGLEPEERVPV